MFMTKYSGNESIAGADASVHGGTEATIQHEALYPVVKVIAV